MSTCKIRLNDLEYTIKEVKKCSVDNAIGTFDCVEGVIEIKQGLSERQLYRTLIHEITHAAVWAYGFASTEVFNEEQLCDFMSAYLDEIYYCTKEVLEQFELGDN